VSATVTMTTSAVQVDMSTDTSASVRTVNDTQVVEAGTLVNINTGGGGGSTTFDATNKAGATVYAGMVVAKHSSGSGYVFANATDDLARAIGVATVDAADNAAGTYQTDGIIDINDWTNATGAATLATNGRYYLDTLNGKLTVTPPSSAGNVVQYIGTALSTTALDISISQPIKKG